MKYMIAYGFLALVTFGYVASSGTCQDSIISSKEECSAIKGSMGGLLWPMYWTWEGFDILRGGTKHAE